MSFQENEDPEDPHVLHMEVKEKSGLVINQPRLFTRLLQPVHHTCTLHMDYKLFAPEAPGKQWLVGYNLVSIGYISFYPCVLLMITSNDHM